MRLSMWHNGILVGLPAHVSMIAQTCSLQAPGQAVHVMVWACLRAAWGMARSRCTLAAST